MTVKMTAMAAMVFAAANGAYGQDAIAEKQAGGADVVATNSDLVPDSKLAATVNEPKPVDPMSLLKGAPNTVEEVRLTQLTLFLAPGGATQKPLVIVDGLSRKTCIQQFGATASDVEPFVCHDTSAMPETDLGKARYIKEPRPNSIDEIVTEGNFFRVVTIGEGTLGARIGLQMTYQWRAEGAQLCTQIIQSNPEVGITDVGCRQMDTGEIMRRFSKDGPRIKV